MLVLNGVEGFELDLCYNERMAQEVRVQNESVAPPPEPDIVIRTMASDIAALKQSGGQIASALDITAGIKEQRDERSLEEVVFKAQLDGAAGKADERETTPTSSKPLIIVLVIIIAVLVLFSSGYFVIFPWLFK